MWCTGEIINNLQILLILVYIPCSMIMLDMCILETDWLKRLWFSCRMLCHSCQSWNVTMVTALPSMEVLDIYLWFHWRPSDWQVSYHSVKRKQLVWWSFHLTHWGQDKMAAISQVTFSNAFSWMKMYEFCLRFPQNMFLRVQLTIF